MARGGGRTDGGARDQPAVHAAAIVVDPAGVAAAGAALRFRRRPAGPRSVAVGVVCADRRGGSRFCREPGQPLAAGRGLRAGAGRGPRRAGGGGAAGGMGGAAVGAPAVAVRLAAGAGQSVPAAQPHGAAARVARAGHLPRPHPLPCARIARARISRRRRRRPAEPPVFRHPGRSARRPEGRAARRGGGGTAGGADRHNAHQRASGAAGGRDPARPGPAPAGLDAAPRVSVQLSRASDRHREDRRRRFRGPGAAGHPGRAGVAGGGSGEGDAGAVGRRNHL